MVRIELLRDLRLTVNGQDVPPPRSKKARLVLAYLAVKPGMHSRELIARTFWGEGDPATSRNSLSKELSVLRKILGQDFLSVTRETVGLPARDGLEIDVREFDRSADLAEFSSAIALWNGGFLQDTAHPWADEQRQRYRYRAARVHIGAAEESRSAGANQRAEDLEVAAVELDPRVGKAIAHAPAIERVPQSPGVSRQTFSTATEMAERIFEEEDLADEISAAEEGRRHAPLLSGFRQLDRMTGGLVLGRTMVVAGRPNMGATTMALTLTSRAAINEGRGCAFFSPALDETELAQRLIAMRARLSGSALRKGQVSQKNWPRIVRAANDLEDSRLFFDDSTVLDFDELEEKVDGLIDQLNGKLDLVVVDDAHLLGGQAAVSADEKAAAEVLYRLCRLGRERGPAVILTTKVSPKAEERFPPRPRLQDVPGYADVADRPEQVLLLYRPDHYDSNVDPPGRLDVQLAENRNGSTGTIPMHFLPSGPRIVEATDQVS